MPGTPEASARLRLAYLAACLIYLAWAGWAMLPDHRKTALRLRLYRSCALVTNRLARRTGEASMGRELATGEQAYGLPYRLSLARLALEHAYDRARGVTS